MNGNNPFSDTGVEDHAALWAARLEGKALTEAERAELESWLASGPSCRAALSSYCRFSSRLDRVVSDLVSSGSIEIRYANEAPVRNRLSSWRLAAAGLAAAAVAMGAVWFLRPSGRAETLSAPAGQRQAFTLADGTRIELNANTSIVVENSRSERRVRLANGEAFFVVSKDKSKPFIVDTPAGSVRVTGTIFNVLTEAASQLEVTVVEGSVQVRAGDGGQSQPSGPVDLKPGGRLSAVKGGVSLSNLTDAELDDSLAWRQGKIVCNQMPLSEALALFAHYHGRSITVTPAAAALRVGGRYSIDDLDGFLAAQLMLQQDHKVRIEHGATGSIRLSLLTEP